MIGAELVRVIPGEIVPDRGVLAAADFLRATALNRPAGDLHPDAVARAYVARAFTLAARRRFRPDCPVAEIARTVATAALRHPRVALPPIEAEMLVRDALGERVPTGGIPADRALTMHAVMFEAIVEELALTEDELDDLLAAGHADADGLMRTAPPVAP